MEAKDKIYHTFYNVKNSWLYFSELKEKTKLSNSSLQNVLKKLEKGGIIEKDKRKSNTFFRIIPDKKSIIFAWIDKERFENLNLGVRIPLKNWLKYIPPEMDFVLLSGSASRKKEGSDIDLIVVLHSFPNLNLQKLYERGIKQEIKQINKKINSESNYPLKVIFTKSDSFKTSEDHLIKQAKETGFPIYGSLKYYEQNEKIKEYFEK